MAYEGILPLTHHGDADIHLDKGSGVVYWILVMATTGSGTIRIRDGSDTGGKELTCIEIQANRGVLYPFSPPLPYRDGLFVDVIDHIQCFTIAYGPVGR